MAGLSDPNYGFMTGLASGVNGFLNTYTTMKNIQHQQQMQELTSGVTKDENGNLTLTPDKQAQLQAQTDQAKHQSALLSSASPESQNVNKFVGGLTGKQIPEGMSGADTEKFQNLLGKDVSGQYALQGKQMSNDMMNNRMGMMLDQRQQRNQMSGNQQYSKEMGNTENTLMSANRVNTLIQGIKAKDLQSTPQLKSDLSAALAQMLNGGKPATVYGMSHQDFDSAYGRAQRATQFLTGTTGDSMTDAQLNQLQKDIAALSGEYQKQHETKFKSFEAGLPEQVRPGLEDRYNKFRQGANVGQGLVGQGQPQGHPQDSAAVQWAKTNPNDPRSAAILKANGM